MTHPDEWTDYERSAAAVFVHLAIAVIGGGFALVAAVNGWAWWSLMGAAVSGYYGRGARTIARTVKIEARNDQITSRLERLEEDLGWR